MPAWVILLHARLEAKKGMLEGSKKAWVPHYGPTSCRWTCLKPKPQAYPLKP